MELVDINYQEVHHSQIGMGRFGLPANFEVEVDLITEPVTLSVIKPQLEPISQTNTNKVFEKAYQIIENYTSTLIESNVKELDARQQTLIS